MSKTIIEIQAELQKLQEQGKSLRQIATDHFEGKVNHAVVQRALKGIEPRDLGARRVLELPAVTYIRQVRNEKGRFA